MTNVTAQKFPRLDTLTSLRWIAAMLVFGRHASGYLPAGVQNFLLPGANGVSFFFILSGFVLTWSHRNGDSPLSFYRRRFARVYPANAVMCLIALWVGITLDNRDFYTVPMVVASLALVQIWYFDWAGGPNSVAWSLSCEVFFYLLFPFMVSRILKFSWHATAVACLVLVAAVFLLAGTMTEPEPSMPFNLLYYFAPTRLLEFVLGMLLAVAVRSGHMPRVPLSAAGALAAVAFLSCRWAPDSFTWVAITLVPWSLLIVAGAQSDLAGKRTWLTHRSMVFLGEVSFAFYLTHQVMVRVLYDLFQFPEGVVAGFAMFLVALLVGLATGTALHLLIERPLERRLRGTRPRVNDEVLDLRSSSEQTKI